MFIKASDFVKRQIKESEFSHFDGSWEELERMTIDSHHPFECEFYWKELEDMVESSVTVKSNVRAGYRDGVVLVSIHKCYHHMFWSSVVPITDDIEFETVFEARRPGEKPYKKSVAYGKKVPAKRVDIVLYRKDVLEEDPIDRDKLTGADWEIVSINCSPTENELPMMPSTLARNQLADTEFGKGGSKANYSGDEFAKSIVFWNSHTMVKER